MNKYITLLFIFVTFLPKHSHSQDLTAEQIFEKVNDAIVVVYSYGFDGLKHAQGSGIILNNKGIIVTNYHIYAGCERLEIKRRDTLIINSGIIGASIEKDILIIKIDDNNYPEIHVSEESTLKVGQKVYAVGSPLGFENTMSEGIVSGLRELKEFEERKNEFIQITASASPGSSGGAVLNSRGELIGMIRMGVDEGENLNFAIPVSDILKVTEGVATDKKTLEILNYFYRGYNEFEIGKFKEAVVDYTKYINQSAGEAKAFNYRGLAYLKLKEYKKAIKDFTKAIKLDAKFIPPYINRAEVYIKMEEYEKASKDLSKLIKMEPKNVKAYYARGLAYSKDESYSKSIKDFTKVIELDPEYTEAYINRGISKFYTKDYSGAMEDWYYAIKLEPRLKEDLTHWIDQADYLRTIGY
jgi:S1-C subfamily serine protease/cytochrome c-type biogenesis protein CcmH/NrfG